MTRTRLEQLVIDLVEKTIKSCEQALNNTGKTTAQIDDVILVGWQTRMPCIQNSVKQFFGKEPNMRINPDEIFALGVAIQAAIL